MDCKISGWDQAWSYDEGVSACPEVTTVVAGKLTVYATLLQNFEFCIAIYSS